MAGGSRSSADCHMKKGRSGKLSSDSRKKVPDKHKAPQNISVNIFLALLYCENPEMLALLVAHDLAKDSLYMDFLLARGDNGKLLRQIDQKINGQHKFMIGKEVAEIINVIVAEIDERSGEDRKALYDSFCKVMFRCRLGTELQKLLTQNAVISDT